MKKISLSLLAIVFAINFSYAQYWTGGPTGPVYYNGGNVGVGTNLPNHLLSLNNSSSGGTYLGLYQSYVDGNDWRNWVIGTNNQTFGDFTIAQSNATGGNPLSLGTSRFYISKIGNVGIGTTTPAGSLDVAGSASYFGSSSTDTHLQIRGYNGSYSSIGNNSGASGNYNGLTLTNNANNANGLTSWTVDIGGSDNISYTNYDTFSIRKGGSEKLRVNTLGNVLIGQTTQANSAYKLDVAGPVRANEIVVNTDGADFVFEPTYKLPSITSVENYIKNNHHLPEIPSAKQMQTEGLSVGENQVKLLQKVEELTLYMIKLKKDSEGLKKENAELKKENTLLKQSQLKINQKLKRNHIN